MQYSNHGVPKKVNCWYSAVAVSLGALIRAIGLAPTTKTPPQTGSPVEDFLSFYAQPFSTGVIDPTPMLKHVIVHYMKMDLAEVKEYQPAELLLDATIKDVMSNRPGMPYIGKFLHPTVRFQEETPDCSCKLDDLDETVEAPPPNPGPTTKLAYIEIKVPANRRMPFTMEDAIMDRFINGIPTGTVNCPDCGRQLRRREKLSLVKPSQCLVISMNRIASDSTGQNQTKITTPVLAAEGLTIPIEKTGINYDLVAAVEHTGKETQEGHYKAHILVEKSWFEVNDDLPITRSSVKSIEKCQLFFYRKSSFQFSKKYAK